MTKEEARLSVMGAISMALKGSTLQQGFEIICKNLSELEKENAELKNRNAELKGMYAHNAREAGTYKQFLELKEKQLAKAKEIIKKLSDAYKYVIQFKEYADKEILTEAEQFLKKE